MTYKAVFAEITYNVTFAKGIEDADKWTATPNTEVKKDTKVDIKYNGAKKVIGVKAAKKAEVKLLTLTVGGDATGVLTYAEGETWGQAIQNHPTENAGWTIGSLSGYILYDDTGVWLGGDRVKKEDAITPGAGYFIE